MGQEKQDGLPRQGPVENPALGMCGQEEERAALSVLVIRFSMGGVVRWGLLPGSPPASRDAQIDVEPLDIPADTTAELIAAFGKGALRPSQSTIGISAQDILSPITGDADLICQGLNYASHAAEAQHHTRKSNLFFAKASSSITSAYGPIERPSEVELLDYEVEFGIVLRGQLPRNSRIAPNDIGAHVAGVVLANDVSARDVMFGASFLQWFQGKSYRTFCPLGPVLYLLEPAEVPRVLESLEIKLWVNGELRQSAISSQLIFKPAETLEQLSRILDLKSGDVVLTGTPGGVTAPATPKMVEILKTHLMADKIRRDELRDEMVKVRPFLKAGDVVTATLRDLGTDRDLGGLENKIASAPDA